MAVTRERETDRLPRSLYADTARAATAAAPLDGDKRVGTVVVGAGFTGLSTALHLARRHADVTVLEAAEPGWGASGRNGGQVNPGLKHEPEEIERRFGKDLGGRMIALSGNAPNRVFALIEEHQIQCEASQSGTIRTAFTAGSARFLRTAAARWRERGAPVDFLEADATWRATGTDRYLCATLDRRGGSVNPLGYARGLAEAATRAGATIHGHTRATAVERRGNCWAVVTPLGTVTADWLVLATNGYTDDLWPGLRRTVVPVYSGIVATEPLPGEIARRILPMRTVVYEHESITVYYRLDISNRLLMGGRSHLRTLENPGDFENLTAYAQRLWPFIGTPAWSHGWNGQLAVTSDHYPHVNEPAVNVITCVGYNGRGVAMATVMGEQIARRITGTPAAELEMPVKSALEPIRFHRLWPLAVTARVAYGRARMALGI